MDWQAILLSLKLALWVVVLLLPVGLLLAWPLVFARFRGKVVLDALVSLPLVLPPTVLGFYLIVAMGPRSPIGRAWEAVTGHTLVFSFSGLVVASVFLNVPFFIQPFVSALAGVDRQALDLEGANQTALFLLAVSFTVLLCTSILRAKERPWS